MNEKFVLLPFDDKYAVSEKGNVINVRSGRTLHTVMQNGYVRVQLSINGVRRNYPVHRLVARAFIPNPENKPYVNHKDGNKQNNCVENLEWVTARENDNHARATGLKEQCKPIKAVSVDDKDTMTFESLSECARYFGTNTGSIHRVLSGKRSKHKGFKFSYL